MIAHSFHSNRGDICVLESKKSIPPKTSSSTSQRRKAVPKRSKESASEDCAKKSARRKLKKARLCSSSADLNILPKTFSTQDLCVNKRKVSEVREWIVNSCRVVNTPSSSKILLIIGPSGCGKRSTLFAICQEEGINVVSWRNHSISSSYNCNDHQLKESATDKRRSNGGSQVEIFKDFLARSIHTPALPLKGNDNFVHATENSEQERKIIMIDDIPNAFYENGLAFNEILLRFSKSEMPATTAIVFILGSPSSSQDYKAFCQLFPPSLLTAAKVTSITFNPFTSRCIQKELLKVYQQEYDDDHDACVDDGKKKGYIDALITSLSGSGDLREAVNTLKFHLAHFPAHAISDSIMWKPENLLKDEFLNVFHFIGKVLYNKRVANDDGDDESHVLASQKFLLSDFHQRPNCPKVSVEDIYAQCPVSVDNTLSFLHHNQLNFLETMDDIMPICDDLSTCAHLLHDWRKREVLSSFAAVVAMRSYMFWYRVKNNSSKWHPITNPKKEYFGALLKKKGRFLRISPFASPKSLLSEILPYQHHCTQNPDFKDKNGDDDFDSGSIALNSYSRFLDTFDAITLSSSLHSGSDVKIASNCSDEEDDIIDISEFDDAYDDDDYLFCL